MLVKMEQVRKHYGAFELNCSLRLEAGRITGLIGPNGAGKTTVFKMILGLITPESGTLEVMGKDTGALTCKDRERLGAVLADSGFSGYLKVSDVTSILASLYADFDRRGFLEGCEKFEIPLNKKIKEFSTGMKAKLKLLAAISHEASFLILDEPTAGLDVIAREEMADLLRSYMEQEGRCILISSHISSDLEGLCDDLYLIDHGSIRLHEETDVLLDEYGLVKVSEEQYSGLDKQYLIRRRREPFGFACLTNQKQFYLENYPDLVVEKGSIDEVITMMIRGECI